MPNTIESYGKVFAVESGQAPIDAARVVPWVKAALDAMGPTIVADLHADDLRWQADDIPDPPTLLCYLADTASELAGHGWEDPAEASVYISAL